MPFDGKKEWAYCFNFLCARWMSSAMTMPMIVTLVHKGAPTFIFHPKTVPLIITRGDPGMATAGSGDVLTGMIAAMIAQGLDARKAATLAVYLHGLSGELAATCLTSYCMTASDLIEFLPEAFQEVLSLSI
jgi:ADP-dependent NAD(P)H-hydrate dehydratase / NAD(P)H-hydrate epimerase